MEITIAIGTYLLVGLIFAYLTYFIVVSEDDFFDDNREFFDKRSNIMILYVICILFWVILLPRVIYNTYKANKENN